MIKIIATIVLWIMCYLISEIMAYKYAQHKYLFLYGWLLSMATGVFINWFVRAIQRK